MGTGDFFSNGMFFALIAIIAVFIVTFIFLKNSANRNNTSDESRQTNDNTISESSGITDENLIAVLTAAVLASMGKGPEYKIRVTSFRRIPQSSPTWNMAGRTDNTSDGLN
ncbi:MAG: OadG family protein [Clostridiaceae bacterium]|nr:OadG family protein [Clostridiaceae bacterium]